MARWVAGVAGGMGLLMTLMTTGAAPALAGPTPEPGAPRAYIVVDIGSGAVLDAKAEHQPMAVAGAVKLMTALTALQRVPSDNDVLTTPLAASAPDPTLGMREGTTWETEDLVQSMLLSSHNDATYALAEGAAGSLERFATEMTRVGNLIGLEDSTFGDAAGLDDEATFTGPSEMSAYDLAVVAANVLADPELAYIVQLRDYRVKTPDGEETGLREGTNNAFLNTYDGASGLKDGSSFLAGNVEVASATRDGRTLVAVVLNAEDPVAVAKRLLDAGFATPRDEKGTGARIPGTRLTTLQGRLIAILGVPRTLGAPAMVNGAQGPNAPVSEVVETVAPQQPNRENDDGGGGNGFPFLRVLALLAGAGLVIAFVLRQRSVRREREQRRIRERALQKARQRGTLDVIEPDQLRDSDDIRIVR